METTCNVTLLLKLISIKSIVYLNNFVFSVQIHTWTGNKTNINWLLWAILENIGPWSNAWTSLALGPYF